MTKDGMKDKISMALKDPILQMGFEVICSKLSRLEKENAELKAFRQDCLKLTEDNVVMARQLTKTKEIIKEMLSILPKENIEGVYEITEEAEQFLKESE